MTIIAHRNGDPPVFGRVVLTIVVLAGAFATFRLLSGTLKAIEHVDRVGDALSELSRYIADGHASIRSDVITAAVLDNDALVLFKPIR